MQDRKRVILHSDLNNFFASVEIANDPSLAGRPLIVCGDPKERHGIVLAKDGGNGVFRAPKMPRVTTRPLAFFRI